MKSKQALEDFDMTTKEKIEIEVPEKKQRVVLTITKRHFFDKSAGKVVTDQVVHRARYAIRQKGKKRRRDDEGLSA